MAVLLGCGLRRSELVALNLGQVQQRENRWVVVDFRGKGGRKRTVPVPAWVKNAIDAWTAAAEITEGRIFRSIPKGAKDGPLESQTLAPHDLRRTCAKLCRKSGGDLEQIQMLLGHASIQTTEKYLGMQQNLVKAVNDKLGIVDAEGE